MPHVRPDDARQRIDRACEGLVFVVAVRVRRQIEEVDENLASLRGQGYGGSATSEPPSYVRPFRPRSFLIASIVPTGMSRFPCMGSVDFLSPRRTTRWSPSSGSNVHPCRLNHRLNWRGVMGTGPTA